MSIVAYAVAREKIQATRNAHLDPKILIPAKIRPVWKNGFNHDYSWVLYYLIHYSIKKFPLPGILFVMAQFTI